MLTEDLLNALCEQLRTITKYSSTELVSRPDEWGPINFEKAWPDIELALSIGRDLSELPVEYLTENTAKHLINLIPGAAQWLKEINEFSIEGGGDPGDNRDQLCASLHQGIEQLQEIAGPAIPYLAFRRGDITENISRLESTLDFAKKTYADTEEWIAQKQSEIEETVRAARRPPPALVSQLLHMNLTKRPKF